MNEKQPPHYHQKDFLRLCDYLGEDLDSDVCREVREHVDACPECKLYFDSIRQMVNLYRENEHTLQAPKDCRQKIIRLITKKKKRD